MASITSRSMPSVAAIDFNEELRRHIVTVPPSLPAFDQQNDDDNAYHHHHHPSPLHRIHVIPLLTDEETSDLLRLARSHATENESWNRQDSTRHVSYPTVDFAVDESIEISQYLGASGIRFEERIFDALGDAFDVDEEDMSFLDLFCASYEVRGAKDDDATNNDSDEERNTMDRLKFHRDGSLLSFTILLSPTEDFEGGGTIFDALGDVVAAADDDDDGSDSVLRPPGVIQPPRAGYATLHSGKLLHGGHAVTRGQRIVLVGFVDVHERNIRPGALGSATKEWGRNDVREFWNRRRYETTERANSTRPVWKLKNWRYLPKDGRSHFGKDSFVPPTVLENMDNRARPERIRRRRLMTEDVLLREMLLPREERGEKMEPDEEEEGEWMEVDPDSMEGLTLGWDDGSAE